MRTTFLSIYFSISIAIGFLFFQLHYVLLLLFINNVKELNFKFQVSSFESTLRFIILDPDLTYKPHMPAWIRIGSRVQNSEIHGRRIDASRKSFNVRSFRSTPSIGIIFFCVWQSSDLKLNFFFHYFKLWIQSFCSLLIKCYLRLKKSLDRIPCYF